MHCAKSVHCHSNQISGYKEPGQAHLSGPAPRGYLVNPYKLGDRMTESSDYESVQVFIGVDAGKDTRHAVAVNRSGKCLFDKTLPNDETTLRLLISDLKPHGQILLVVDQPATIGA